jgi:hypothetical protein
MNDKPKAKRYRSTAERKARRGGKPGSPKFVPDDNQRHVVLSCAGMKMSRTEIAQLIRNPHTGEALSLKVFDKVFKDEMQQGGANLKGTIATQYAKALEAGKEFAVRLGLRNKFGWVNEGSQPPPALLIENNTGTEEIQIRFFPGPGNKPEPVDITPPAPDPYANQQPDPSLPQIEPPRERTRTPFGAIHEEPRQTSHTEWPSYESQTGEPRPSMFDTPRKGSWMK